MSANGVTAGFRVLARHAANSIVAVGAGDARTALDLVTDADAIASSLPARDGDVLVVCADRYLSAACALAAWSRGKAIALPPNAQPGTVQDIAHAASTAVLLHDSDDPHGIDVRTLVGHTARGGAYAAPAPLAAQQRLATIWTSGSSGAPRLCDKRAAQLLGEAEMLASVFGWESGDVTLSTVPAFHLYGLLFGVLAPLVSGGAFVRGTPLFAPTIATCIVETRATVLVSVPPHLRALESLTREAIEGRRPRVCSSGAPLARETADALAVNLGWKVTEIFGSTETGGIAHRSSVDSPYVPFAGVSVEADAEARLVLRSPFNDAGPESATVTDDRVALEGDGRFRLLGRVGGIVKVAGKRVSTAEVEARIRRVPGVTDVAVITRDAPGARRVRLAAVVEAQGLTVEALRAALREHLDPAVVPRPLVLVHVLPREPTGKLRRDELLALLGGHPEKGRPHPGDGLELRPREGGGFDVHVPIDARAFAGHFAGEPVLPGVVQLHTLVLGAVHRLWPELGHPRRITKLKFHKPVRPGDDLVVQLERSGARVSFALARRDAVCTNGTMFFADARSEEPVA